jgi:pteridine reductase
MTHHIETPNATHGKLEGKIALVTGAGRRIGRAIAIALAEEGVHIVAHDRRALETETIKVCEEVVDCGAKSWKVIADLEKPEEYETLVSQALTVAGSLDIVINNASLFRPNTLKDVDLSSLTQHVQVNAWAPFVISREFARLVGRGKIINLLDTKITGYDRQHVAYILSKHLLSALTDMCALEFAPNIMVNAVAPGLILPPSGKDEAYLDRLSHTVPLKQHGGPDDIADAVLYLLRSDFVTGQVIYVDGGRHLLEGGNGPDPDQ